MSSTFAAFRNRVQERARWRLEQLGYRVEPQVGRVRQLVSVPPLGDHRDVPVVINNFNRSVVLEQLLGWLVRAGMRRVLVLDNASRYPGTLALYGSIRAGKIPGVEVVELGRNLGFRALWRSSVWRRVRGHYSVYTDPDVLPVEECPLDVVRALYDVLIRFPDRQKAGLGIKIDDLPDHYDKKDEVVRWEQQYWQKQVAENVYDAPVDTTFALYRPWARGGWWTPALRTGGALMLRHMPWYMNSKQPDEEELFYRGQVLRASTHWMG